MKFTISNFSLFLFASWVVIEINSVEVVVAYVAQVVMGMEKVTWVGFWNFVWLLGKEMEEKEK